MSQQLPQLRVGQGLDVHRLVSGRALFLGGVKIPYEKGLEGHSDADVLLHAIIDALFGACGMNDIGHAFPNTDERWRGADSAVLLAQSWKMVSAEGWRIINIDCCVSAEAPKLKPYIQAMKTRIAGILTIEAQQCGIKAGTFEGLSFVGRGEGIMASCVVLLSK